METELLLLGRLSFFLSFFLLLLFLLLLLFFFFFFFFFIRYGQACCLRACLDAVSIPQSDYTNVS